MSVLVIAAHPDDEVLGCGGTIARESADTDVQIVILGEGLSSRHGLRTETSAAELETLRQDGRASAEILGARRIEFGGLPDNRFDEVSMLDIVKQVEEWIRRFGPSTIYTHHPGDLNIDHGIAFRAVLTATRPGALTQSVRKILAFEVPSSTEWAFQSIATPFRPNTFVDVSATIERKIAAMACYRSEARPAPHPRSPEALRALAVYRGATSGVRFAEAFELVRLFR